MKQSECFSRTIPTLYSPKTGDTGISERMENPCRKSWCRELGILESSRNKSGQSCNNSGERRPLNAAPIRGIKERRWGYHVFFYELERFNTGDYEDEAEIADFFGAITDLKFMENQFGTYLGCSFICERGYLVDTSTSTATSLNDARKCKISDNLCEIINGKLLKLRISN